MAHRGRFYHRIHAALGSRPIADRRGLDRRPGAAQHDRPRPADRPARLSPLLGRRAPRRTDARRTVAGGADRADRVGDRGDPRRLRRRDAAALQPAEGGRVVHDPGGAVPRPDRSRARARVGHRPDDDLRAAARPPPGLARRLSPAAGRAARLLRGRPAGRPPVPPARQVAARACPSCRCRGCWARRSRARSGPASSVSPTRSPTSSTRPARRSPRPTASASSPSGRCRRSAPRSPPGCCARRPTRRRSSWRPRARWR